MRLILTALLLAFLSSPLFAGGEGPLQEIFFAPFEGSPTATIARGMGESYQAVISGYEEGVVGKAARSDKKYTGIRYDGRGNIDLDRGTFAFFYKPLEEPNVDAWESLAGVSTEMEGYWAGIFQFISKQDINKKTVFDLHFFDIGRYSPVLHFKPIYQRWHKNEWHHLAAVWDRAEGIKIYEDGQLADSNWGTPSGAGIGAPIRACSCLAGGSIPARCFPWMKCIATPRA